MSGGIGHNRAEIIIKKVKGGGHGGHHGGAWKVAYADFVTAMMAFFLLLWLLSTTTEEQKRGISEYFTPEAASLSGGGAGGALGGISVTGDEGAAAASASTVVLAIQPPSAPQAEPDEDAFLEFQERQEQEAFEEAQDALRQAILENPELADVAENLIIDMTPEGMRIQIVDQEGGSMFASGSAEMAPRTRKLLEQIAQVVTKLPNKISVSGHTDAQQFGGAGGYSNWELSSDRANASRRGLIQGGLTPDRFAEVTGKAAQEPLLEEDPFAPQNRRISLILLREAPVLPPELQTE